MKNRYIARLYLATATLVLPGGITDKKKIKQLCKRLRGLLRKVGNIKPRELRRFAEACGYELLHGKREPTYRHRDIRTVPV